MDDIILRFDRLNFYKIQQDPNHVNMVNYNKVYIFDENINTCNFMIIDNIELNFKELYSVFKRPPKYYEYGKTGLVNLSFFEWKLFFENEPYSLHSWVDDKKWNIASITTDKLRVNRLKDKIFTDLNMSNLIEVN